MHDPSISVVKRSIPDPESVTAPNEVGKKGSSNRFLHFPQFLNGVPGLAQMHPGNTRVKITGGYQYFPFRPYPKRRRPGRYVIPQFIRPRKPRFPRVRPEAWLSIDDSDFRIGQPNPTLGQTDRKSEGKLKFGRLWNFALAINMCMCIKHLFRSMEN